MYWEIAPELREIIEPIATMRGLELVDAQLRAASGKPRLWVIVDRTDGGRVTVEECASVARELGRALDVAEVISGAYLLEVSSPGVDRVLAREVDFERAVGQRVAVETREPVLGRRKFQGRLAQVAGATLAIELEEGAVEIPLSSVKRANSIYEFAPTSGRKRPPGTGRASGAKSTRGKRRARPGSRSVETDDGEPPSHGIDASPVRLPEGLDEDRRRGTAPGFANERARG